MKITLVAHGLIEIPPTGYGAVESLITDYAWALGNAGHSVTIVNENDFDKAVEQVNASAAGLVWVHDDRKSIILPRLKAKKIAITSHDPTLFKKKINPLVRYFTDGTHQIGCLCQDHYDGFIAAGVDPGRLFMCPNGARADLIRFAENPKRPGTLICVGVVSKRKRQHMLVDIPNVHFVGDFSTYDPVPDHKALKGDRWQGPWTKKEVHNNLTDYGAAILLSDSEAAALAVPEYLMAGLPCILSRAAAVNVPGAPFVKVLDDWILNNPQLVHIEIDNFMKRTWDRRKIRKFAEKHFDWEKLVKKLNFHVNR